jgi:hypothetical protein
LGENLAIDDHAFAVVGADADAGTRQQLVKLFVPDVLIAQATFKSAAPTGYLSRIEGGLLQLGHSHGDGPKRLEKHFATDLSPASFVIGQEPGFIPGPHLPHLDPRAVLMGQIFDDRPEVDTLRRRKKENDPLAAKGSLAIHYTQGQLVTFSDFTTKPAFLTGAVLNSSVFREVGGRRLTEDSAGVEDVGILAARTDPFLHLIAGDGLVAAVAGERHLLANLDPAASLDHHLGPAGELQVRGVGELTDVAHEPEADGRGGVNLLQPVAAFRSISLSRAATSAPSVAGRLRRFGHELFETDVRFDHDRLLHRN